MLSIWIVQDVRSEPLVQAAHSSVHQQLHAAISLQTALQELRRKAQEDTRTRSTGGEREGDGGAAVSGPSEACDVLVAGMTEEVKRRSGTREAALSKRISREGLSVEDLFFAQVLCLQGRSSRYLGRSLSSDVSTLPSVVHRLVASLRAC